MSRLEGGRIMKYIGFIVLMLGTAFLILVSGFTLPTTVALSVLILAITADFYTTWRCLRIRGREGNPMVAFLFKRIGLRLSFCLMAGLWALIIVFRFLPAVESAQTAIALVYWVVPMNNLIILRRLRKRAYV